MLLINLAEHIIKARDPPLWIGSDTVGYLMMLELVHHIGRFLSPRILHDDVFSPIQTARWQKLFAEEGMEFLREGE